MTEHLRVNDTAQRTLNKLGDLCREVLDAFRAFGLRTRWQPEANVVCPQRVEAELLARKLGPGGP